MGGRSEVRQGTVLVVDDEETVRGVLARLLAHFGYTVLVAASGDSALAIVRAGGIPLDCVLLDVAMPGMSGIETAHAIHAEAPELPIVLMSGHAGPWIAERGGVPAQAFLQKPFAFEELHSVLSGVAAAAGA
jgi:CheY-like chemotaxis protein